MDLQTHPLIHMLLFVLGLVLIIGGIARAAPGAAVIGLIVAAINFQHLPKTSFRI